MILTRRLELQLAEIDKAEATEESKSPESKQKKANGESTANSLTVTEIEDEKERTIAKAALTIAELS